jgi:hypothetical protein
MKSTCRLLFGLIAIILMAGCTSKEKKNDENTTTNSTTVKDFERILPPTLLIDPKDRAGYMIVHFWDHFDFRDTMYCHAPQITEQAFSDFINLFSYASYDKVKQGVQKLLDSAEVDVVMYNYFLHRAEQYLYDPNSPTRNDEYYIPFLEQTIASEKVTDVSKIRPRQLLQLAYRNRPGAKAEDIVYTTASGRAGRLYSLTAPYILVMFFNPDCYECKQTTDQLKNSQVIASAVASGRLKVLAVYPDENLEIWKKHLKDLPPAWINSYDQSHTIRQHQTYDLKAIPTLYLLDESKRVLLKDATTAAIHEYFEKVK